MAYLDVTTLHSLPVNNEVKPVEPAAILFPRGPQWSWRYQRNQQYDRLDDRFMYKDQGPPMYRLLGHHYNMYAIPPRTDFHNYAKSFHYEPRQYNAPNYRNGALAFPPGPPPAQVAQFDGLKTPEQREPQVSRVYMPNKTIQSIKQWDKYRYLPGPPSEVTIYGKPQGWEVLPGIKQ